MKPPKTLLRPVELALVSNHVQYIVQRWPLPFCCLRFTLLETKWRNRCQCYSVLGPLGPAFRNWKGQAALGRGSEPFELSTGLPQAEWNGRAKYQRIFNDLQGVDGS